MTIERRNPLPVGRYWQDIMGDVALVKWQSWVKGLNADRENVAIDATESFAPVDGSLPRTWILFRVLHEVVWAHDKIGSPTVAGEIVHTSDDTVQKPPPEKPPADQLEDSLEQFLEGLKVFGYIVGGTAVFVGVATIASKFVGRRR